MSATPFTIEPDIGCYALIWIANINAPRHRHYFHYIEAMRMDGDGTAPAAISVNAIKSADRGLILSRLAGYQRRSKIIGDAIRFSRDARAVQAAGLPRQIGSRVQIAQHECNRAEVAAFWAEVA